MQLIYLGGKSLRRKDISAFGTRVYQFPYHPHISVYFFLCPHHALRSLVSQNKRAGRRNQASFKAAFPYFLSTSGAGPRDGVASGFLSCSPFCCFLLPTIRFISSPQGSLTIMSAWTAQVFPTDSLAHHSPPSSAFLRRFASHCSQIHLSTAQALSLASTTLAVVSPDSPLVLSLLLPGR